jgi:transcriptional regulator with XRE-family HTH domain
VAGARNPTSPTVRRRELGAILRDLRGRANLTVEQVAAELLCSSSKISRLETGQRGASPRDIRDLCDLYGVTEQAERERLARLAREGKEQGWWQSFDLPYGTYVGLETAASAIKDFEPGVFPGLLQTPEYARALHERGMPRLSPAAIEQRIEERLRRQGRLTSDNPPDLHAIFDESVIRRVVAGPAVMVAQLDRVIQAASLPNVTVQIVPFQAGAHPALDSTFILLEYSPPVPAVVYVEGLAGRVYLEHPQDVRRYRQVFERLCGIALSPQESVDLMAEASTAYKSG